MFKNIEISEINRSAVQESAWSEFGTLCVLGYVTILVHLLTDQQGAMETTTLNLVFMGLFVLAYFLYASFFYWGFILLFDWLLERFFITNTTGEKQVYLIFCLEMVFATVIIFSTRNLTHIGKLWPYFLIFLLIAKLVRIFILKRKNRLLNKLVK